MIQGIFIGIDKYRDPGIRDLAGASRDATALWSLFLDTIPGMEAQLFKDADATRDGLGSALRSVLTGATPDDLVVISFSGHGTHDHRLVAHDTDKTALRDTTLGMVELTDLFRGSPARSILCVIDCCFSGGAPARVLEDSPVPKDPGTPLEILAGKGRILIAASNIDEVAYESPSTRHGLLTKALIDVLVSGDDTIDLTSAMAAVMENVRAAATRLGVIQTPVMFGYVEGGLVIPALRRGRRFQEAFPEASAPRVGNTWAELSAFGLPVRILQEWTARFPGGLNQLQLTAVNEYRVLDDASLLVIAPTTSGKTFIGELAATKAIAEGRKAVFLLPYKALVNEKFDVFSELYGSALGMRVLRCSGDYTDQVDAFVRGKYDLALLTFEMFLNLAVATPSVLNTIGLVVLDEGQFVTDPGRGITVELLLTYLLMARVRGVKPQLVILSAVIGDSNGLEEWLDCRKMVSGERPVPLVEGVLDRSGTFQFIDVDGNDKCEQLLPRREIVVRRDKPSSQDVIVPLVRQLLGSGNEKVIVFRNQRGTAEGCAGYLAAEMGLPAVQDAIASLPSSDLSTTSARLRQCLAGGTAFHSTNLTREERQIVERAFRDPAGRLRVLGATTTVAAGINTPASTVVLAEQEFLGEDGRPFTVAEYKNMAGRAGRLGFIERGKAIILANDPMERGVLFQRYVKGRPESVSSSFRMDDIDTWVIRLLAQVKEVPRVEASELLSRTYGGYLASKRQAGWREAMEERLRSLIERMIQLGLLEEENERLRLTLLGSACGRSSLSLPSAMRLVELLRVAGPGLSPEQVMGLVQALPELDDSYTPMLKKGHKEAVRPNEAVQRYGGQVVGLLQRYANDSYGYWARCKRASILWDWVTGVSIEEIESTYTTTPYQGKIGYGDARKFADLTRYHLRPATEIAALLFPEYGTQAEAMDRLQRRLEVGLPEDALGLLGLPLPLGRGDYLTLHQQGLKCSEDVWNLSDDDLRRILRDSTGRALAGRRPVTAQSKTLSTGRP